MSHFSLLVTVDLSSCFQTLKVLLLLLFEQYKQTPFLFMVLKGSFIFTLCAISFGSLLFEFDVTPQ